MKRRRRRGGCGGEPEAFRTCRYLVLEKEILWCPGPELNQ